MVKAATIFKGLLCLVAASATMAVEKEGDDPLQWLRDSIPGEPSVDYPIFASVEQTSFSCEGKIFGGYYADPEMGCQAYHVCLFDPIADRMYPTSFLCPNGTLFQQQVFNCDWWYNVDCAAAEGLYGLVENAFGAAAGAAGSGNQGGGGGQCPNVNPLSEAECSGTVSNCWSPGQPDTDCPKFGLCCFDGCANTCVDGPEVSSDALANPQTTPKPTPRPTSAPAPVITTTPARPTPAPVITTTGYSYPVPEVTLPVRPVTTPAAPTQRPSRDPAPISTPSTLYGAPPELVPGFRKGRKLRQRRQHNVNQLGRQPYREATRVLQSPADSTTYIFV